METRWPGLPTFAMCVVLVGGSLFMSLSTHLTPPGKIIDLELAKTGAEVSRVICDVDRRVNDAPVRWNTMLDFVLIPAYVGVLCIFSLQSLETGMKPLAWLRCLRRGASWLIRHSRRPWDLPGASLDSHMLVHRPGGDWNFTFVVEQVEPTLRWHGDHRNPTGDHTEAGSFTGDLRPRAHGLRHCRPARTPPPRFQHVGSRETLIKLSAFHKRSG